MVLDPRDFRSPGEGVRIRPVNTACCDVRS